MCVGDGAFEEALEAGHRSFPWDHEEGVEDHRHHLETLGRVLALDRTWNLASWVEVVAVAGIGFGERGDGRVWYVQILHCHS